MMLFTVITSAFLLTTFYLFFKSLLKPFQWSRNAEVHGWVSSQLGARGVFRLVATNKFAACSIGLSLFFYFCGFSWNQGIVLAAIFSYLREREWIHSLERLGFHETLSFYRENGSLKLEVRLALDFTKIPSILNVSKTLDVDLSKAGDFKGAIYIEGHTLFAGSTNLSKGFSNENRLASKILYPEENVELEFVALLKDGILRFLLRNVKNNVFFDLYSLPLADLIALKWLYSPCSRSLPEWWPKPLRKVLNERLNDLRRDYEAKLLTSFTTLRNHDHFNGCMVVWFEGKNITGWSEAYPTRLNFTRNNASPSNEFPNSEVTNSESGILNLRVLNLCKALGGTLGQLWIDHRDFTLWIPNNIQILDWIRGRIRILSKEAENPADFSYSLDLSIIPHSRKPTGEQAA